MTIHYRAIGVGEFEDERKIEDEIFNILTHMQSENTRFAKIRILGSNKDETDLRWKVEEVNRHYEIFDQIGFHTLCTGENEIMVWIDDPIGEDES